MNGCIYKTADGQCEKFSDKTRNTMSWCVGDEPCEGRTPSNADRIRQMSDEELAKYLSNICYDLWEMFVDDPKKMWLDWLKAPVEVDE